MYKSVSRLKKFICLCISFVCLIFSVCVFPESLVFATDVNNVSGSSQESSESSKSVADGLSEAFNKSAVDNADIAEASRLTEPAVKIIRLITSIILALIGGALGLVTILDLVYIMLPPARNFLGGGQQSTPAPMGGGMMGGGMMGGGMMSAQSQNSGGTRFISDEAISALNESMPQGGQGGMMGMNMGAKPKTKTVILTYAKKRMFVLICFFACLVLFTSTAFTDIGLYIGQWILDTLGGFF